MGNMLECMCSDGFKEWATDPKNVQLDELMHAGQDPMAFAGMEPLMCSIDTCYVRSDAALGPPRRDLTRPCSLPTAPPRLLAQDYMSGMFDEMGTMAAEFERDRLGGSTEGPIMTAVYANGGPDSAVESAMTCMCSSTSLFTAMMEVEEGDSDLVGAAMGVSAVGFCANDACRATADVFTPMVASFMEFEARRRN